MLSREVTQFPDAGEKFELTGLNAEVLVLGGSEIVRAGPSSVLVIRFANGFEFVPHHFESEGVKAPMTIGDWAERLGAPVVFNAGQFDENFAHLGWLKRDGAWMVPYRHPAWQGLLASGPTDGAAWARIVDLDIADAKVVERYRHVMQSMMLVDDQGRPRVRVSDKATSRTVVAEDQLGRILLIIVEGAVTLADLAKWLPQQNLKIVRAMNLDGGIESQVAVRTAELDLTFHARHGSGLGSGALTYRIPAVVAVRPIPRANEGPPKRVR